MKNIVEIKRPDGNIEIVDVTGKVPPLTKDVVEKIKKSTSDAGRGEVVAAYKLYPATWNRAELEKLYANTYNDGNMDGYIPEDRETLKSCFPAQYKEIEERKEVIL